MLNIITKTISDFEQNARVLIDTETKEVSIVDPGAEIELLLALAKPDENKLVNIHLTHCHLDHGGGVRKMLRHLAEQKIEKPTLCYHSKDQLLADNIGYTAKMYGFPEGHYEDIPKADLYLDNLSHCNIGSQHAEIRFVPGHAPGHTVLFFPNGNNISLDGDFAEDVAGRPVLIGGDTLFRGSIGRTDLPMGDHETLISAIRKQLFTLPDETLVLTGHGPNTTIGTEKKSNPFFI